MNSASYDNEVAEMAADAWRPPPRSSRSRGPRHLERTGRIKTFFHRPRSGCRGLTGARVRFRRKKVLLPIQILVEFIQKAYVDAGMTIERIVHILDEHDHANEDSGDNSYQ
jgi:hypothetical protein